MAKKHVISCGKHNTLLALLYKAITTRVIMAVTKIKINLAVILLAFLVFMPAGVQADAISFGGNAKDDGKDVHLQDQGIINFDWIKILSSGSDPLLSTQHYLGFRDIDVFAATGSSDMLSTGDAFSGLNYQVDFYITDDPDFKGSKKDNLNNNNLLSRDNHEPGDFVYGATFTITSISLPSAYELVINGNLTEVQNNLTTSTFLNALSNGNSMAFTLSGGSKAAESGFDSFAQVLNGNVGDESGDRSIWALANGNINNIPGGSTPEPGTLMLLFSALGTGFYFRKRFMPNAG
jgi:hypothetical protein